MLVAETPIATNGPVRGGSRREGMWLAFPMRIVSSPLSSMASMFGRRSRPVADRMMVRILMKS